MTPDDWWREGVEAPRRLDALARSGLFETAPEDAFDRLTELAAAVTGAVRACITLVDRRSFAYKSTVGIPDETAQTGPIEESFCRCVVGSSKPFIVDDARRDPRTFDNPAIAIHGVAAWAGYPIEDADGWVLGTFCLIATEPYAWTDQDLHVLATLTQAASSEIALRRAQTVIASARSAAYDIRAATDPDPVSRVATTPSLAIVALRDRVALLVELLSSAPGPIQRHPEQPCHSAGSSHHARAPAEPPHCHG